MSIEIIRHELGHWVTANVLGFEVGEITLQRGVIELSASAQSSPHVPLYGKTRKILKYCERRIAVLLGGVASEVLFEEIQTSERSLELLETVGKDDFQKIKELLYLKASIRNIRKDSFQDYQRLKIEKCWGIALKILEDRRDNINIASSKMENTFSLKSDIVFKKHEIEAFLRM